MEISIAHESQIPILNGGSDENPCKSHDSTANLVINIAGPD